tara:strand:- start:8688 stop:8906 length:219 start_codon:yes stop_codon:yes gene_type:complete
MEIQGMDISDEAMAEIVEDAMQAVRYFNATIDMEATEGEAGHITSMMAYMGLLEATIDEAKQGLQIARLLRK